MGVKYDIIGSSTIITAGIYAFGVLLCKVPSREDSRKIEMSVMLSHRTEIFSKRRKIYA